MTKADKSSEIHIGEFIIKSCEKVLGIKTGSKLHF